MDYYVKHGEPDSSGQTNDAWFQALRNEGWTGGLPIDRRPELYEDLAFVWTAFWELSSSRAMAFDFGPIPYPVITDYLNEEEIFDPGARDYYRRMIRVMDNVFLNQKRKGSRNVKTSGDRNFSRSAPLRNGRRSR